MLSSNLHGMEPAEFIEKYADAYMKDTTQKMIGDVLAYKNTEGKTVVLKSGNLFANTPLKEVISGKVDVELSLVEVLSLVSSGKKEGSFTIKNFLDACENGNDSWKTAVAKAKKDTYTQKSSASTETASTETNWDKYKENFNLALNDKLKGEEKTKHNDKRKKGSMNGEKCKIATTIKDLLAKNKDTEPINLDLGNVDVGPLGHSLQQLLEVYRHTELQIQALLSAYNSAQGGCKESIKKFLPVALIDGEDGKGIDTDIYSLFEACQCCNETQWLKEGGKKTLFKFKIIDGQYGNRFRKPEDKTEYQYQYKHSSFMTQSDLEALLKKSDPINYTENGFEAIKERKEEKSTETEPAGKRRRTE